MAPLILTTRTHKPASPRGFSLIEVLMAVLILSLGLLGLGAIMPAVVKQQRVGTDQTFGTLAARSVGAAIKGNALLNTVNPTLASANRTLQSYNRWEGWARCIPTTGANSYADGIPEDGSWKVLTVEAEVNGIGTARTRIGPSAGPAIGPVDDAYINLQDRLVPSITSVTASAGVISEPQFVVDIAVRRMTPIVTSGPANQIGPGGTLLYERPGNFTVQVALISRRVDQRIRPPAGISTMRAVAEVTGPAVNRRWPISEDNNGNPLGGGETRGNGAPRYSLPYTVDVSFDPNFPDRLIVTGADPSSLSAGGTIRTSQVAYQQIISGGQIIADNLGTVYTVQGSDDRVTGQLALRISPPVANNVPATGIGSLNQLLVCPQPPASINIITVNP